MDNIIVATVVHYFYFISLSFENVFLYSWKGNKMYTHLNEL